MKSYVVPAGGVAQLVDDWKFDFSLPDADGSTSNANDPDLWLNSITRTGHTGGATQSLPATLFQHAASGLSNVVGGQGTIGWAKFRITSVRNDLGGRLDITYGHDPGHACDSGMVGLERWASTGECFATRWAPPAGGTPQWTWFHKYTVSRIAAGDDTLSLRDGEVETNPVTLGRLQVIDYDYRGEPAWRFAGTRNTDTSNESWTDWRGYETTVVHTRMVDAYGHVSTADSDDVARQRITRFRGMSKAPVNPTDVNNGADGPAKYVDSEQYPGTGGADDNPAEEDRAWFEGLTVESSTRTSAGAVIERTFTDYGWILTADDTDLGRKSRLVFPTNTITTTGLFNAAGAATGTRSHVVDYTVDGTPGGGTPDTRLLAGTTQTTIDRGDTPGTGPAATADDVCVRTIWKANSADSAWIRVPATTVTTAVSCAAGDGTGGGTLLGKSTTTYDNGGTLTHGLPTATDTWITPTGDPATGDDVVHTATGYDTYGRVLTTTGPGDGDHQLVTQNVYNPGGSDDDVLTGLQVTQVDVLDPDTHPTGTTDMVTTTTLEPGRGVPTLVTDPNGTQTRVSYDPLGRITQVRLPGRGSGEPASIEYTYTITATDPSRVKTHTLRADANPDADGGETYDDAWVYTDGWGRSVETQTPAPDGTSGRIVATTGYDEQGLARYTMPAIPNPTAPGTGVLNAAPANVARYAVTDYDAAGRPTTTVEKSNSTTLAT